MNLLSNVMLDHNEFDFGRKYPVKSIHELKTTPEIGVFVVEGCVAGFSQLDPWWYPICLCHRIVEGCLGLFYCHMCQQRDFLIIPKYVSAPSVVPVLLVFMFM
jgi:hypothetical protein